MPKIIGGSLVEHREQTRERILQAMVDLLDSKGYDSITLADIAAAADIGRTAMYNYYPDKESVLLDLAEHETEQYTRKLRFALAGLANPIERLAAFVRMQLAELATQHFAAASLRSALSEQGRYKMYQHVAPLTAILRDILRDAVADGYLPDADVDTLLPLVAAATSGRITADLSGQRLQDAIDAAVRFVLRGSGARLDAGDRPVRLSRRARASR